MNSIENKVQEHMNDEGVQYPDFDRLWTSIQRDELRMEEEVVPAPRWYRQKKTAIAAGLTVALMATPVYAAIQYDWNQLLSGKPGIQMALLAGYGQPIEQSVTADGVTLTVHTAFIDENRTVLLYTIRPGVATEGQEIRYDQIVLKDSQGSPLEGRYVQQWNAELGVYQGYFESNWVMQSDQIELQFAITNVRYLEDREQEIPWNPRDKETQKFEIQQDGIQSVTIQSFPASSDYIRIHSAVSFTDQEVQEDTWARIRVYDRDHVLLQEAQAPEYGTAGATGAYSSRQLFNEQELLNKGGRFTLAYTHVKARTEGEWKLNLSLSREQMEKNTYNQPLDIPLSTVAGDASISEMIVTPTQIRVTIKHAEENLRIPYQNFQLEAAGQLMNGRLQLEGEHDPHQTEIRFEPVKSAVLDPSTINAQPVVLIAKDRMDEHAGGSTSVHLTNISSQPQTIHTDYDGYPIRWTYYTKDGNLYVESDSTSADFGEVNQTYYLQGGEKQYSMPQFSSGLDSKHVDVFDHFTGTDLNLYVWNYTTLKKGEQLRIQLTE
ncbi:DUF4179 domain-containing protein [Paenibacillus sp. FSL K6-1230]|uniref:DUF4179 domain-containing protein n=1 Tax=Paenibacillus sp. FSL K6-1230 TaxID=2921603 RepID=UPI0030F96AB4